MPVASGAVAPALQQPRDLLLAIAVPREVGFLPRLQLDHFVLASPLARVVAWSAAAVPALQRPPPGAARASVALLHDRAAVCVCRVAHQSLPAPVSALAAAPQCSVAGVGAPTFLKPRPRSEMNMRQRMGCVDPATRNTVSVGFQSHACSHLPCYIAPVSGALASREVGPGAAL